jgi:hypothetical protein
LGNNLWNFPIPASDPKVKSVSTLDFFFTLGPANAVNPLYAARLDIDAGAEIPTNWYRKILPFSFDIHDVTKQRGSVTILNNVINPTVGETVRVSYQLAKAGRTVISVFTLDGDMVKILYRGTRAAGTTPRTGTARTKAAGRWPGACTSSGWWAPSWTRSGK